MPEADGREQDIAPNRPPPSISAAGWIGVSGGIGVAFMGRWEDLGVLCLTERLIVSGSGSYSFAEISHGHPSSHFHASVWAGHHEANLPASPTFANRCRLRSAKRAGDSMHGAEFMAP